MNMRRVSWLAAIWLVLPLFAQTSGQGDPYTGSLHGRIYSNAFFGFSCEVPKGWATIEQMMERSSHPQRQVAMEETKKRFRARGILLATMPDEHPDIPVLFAESEPGSKPTFGLPIDNFTITVRTPEPGTPSDSAPLALAEAEVQRIRARDAKATISSPEKLIISGQDFVRLGWVRSLKNRHSSSFVTSRRGYSMSFVFNANTQKDLAGLEKVMKTVQFEPSAVPQ